MKLRWQFYPKWGQPPEGIYKLINIFENLFPKISSEYNQKPSDEVLEILSADLIDQGFEAEISKKREGKIRRPVLFGENGKISKSFELDAYYPSEKIALEIEAGRGVLNYHFLKDLFEACTIPSVDYLAIAVRQKYLNKKDFETVITFFDTLYASNRISLPLKGILILGY